MDDLLTRIILPFQILPLFFFNDTATTEIYTLSLHDALPISHRREPKEGHSEDALDRGREFLEGIKQLKKAPIKRSEEHTSELQSRPHLVCRLLLEKKNLLGTALHEGELLAFLLVTHRPEQLP